MARAGNTRFGRGLAAQRWVFAAALMGTAVGCGSDAGSSPETTDATDGPNTSSGGASDSTAASDSTGSSSGGDVAEASSGSSGSAGSSDSGSGGDTPPPAADGESCASAEGCISGACFDAGILGGICGACASSADCDAGCHPPNPFIDPRVPSVCEPDDAEASACESAADCGGGSVCATILTLPGVFDVRGCGSCESAKDCARGERCSPTYDLPGLGGTRSCVAPTTLEDGAHCDPQNGADVCLNACRSVDFEGLATVGVCSMCAGDGDCTPKTEVCAPPELVDGELQPAACVPAKMPG